MTEKDKKRDKAAAIISIMVLLLGAVLVAALLHFLLMPTPEEISSWSMQQAVFYAFCILAVAVFWRGS